MIVLCPDEVCGRIRGQNTLSTNGHFTYANKKERRVKQYTSQNVNLAHTSYIYVDVKWLDIEIL